jgi:hypothetical protein
VALANEDEITRLSGWVREQNSFSNVPCLNREMVKRVLAAPMPRLRNRAMKALKVVVARYGNLETWHVPAKLISDLELLGSSYCATPASARDLLHVLGHDGFLEQRNDMVRLTVRGLLAVEEMSSPTNVSSQGFVAMYFADSMREAWTNGSWYFHW